MFVGTLSVREYLSIQARLRANLSPEKREKRINVVLTQLGLLKCQNTRIGIMGVLKGISGKNLSSHILGLLINTGS
ncbi:unnamed protein product [Strongylus vulgaris]|uniref:Uncharacterized protein n=1 Tax=Strongylus vulgaris TaxID=40348 RepID=A0A3P7JBJ3_STRVU|nr:unnamed protein product [Strongylus vulgaris]